MVERCGYRQKNTLTGFLWECVRPPHGPREQFDPQGRRVGVVGDHWFRKVEEDEDEDGDVGRRTT